MEKHTEIRELSQFVAIAEGDIKKVEQSVTFDPADEWVHIVHAGNEISLSRKNWESLKKLAYKTIDGTLEYNYKELKNLPLKESKIILTALTDDQILELMREDAKHVKFKYWDVTGFTKLLVQEIFKRNGLGYKSLHKLSTAQQGFIENLNIYEKQFYGKP